MDGKFGWDLQAHLENMEGRIRTDIASVKSEVKEANERIQEVETRVETTQAKLKWVWRVAGASMLALGSKLGIDLTAGGMP